MKLLAAITGGVAFYLGCYFLANRYGPLWLVIAMVAIGVVLSL